MIPAVHFILRGALALVVMFLVFVLSVAVMALDELSAWLVPEADLPASRKRRPLQ